MKPVNALLVMPCERRASMLEPIEACGVHVFVTAGIEEARGILDAHPVDLIFTDVSLAQGDWRDVMALRTSGANNPEVILCAKRLDSRLCAEAFSKGVWDVLADSCTREEMSRTIESAVSRRYMHSLGLPAMRAAS